MGANTNKIAEITIKEEKFELYPERAAFWRERETLFVADLHWGKGETFRSSGIPVPHQMTLDELSRLELLIAKTGTKRLVVLGDLIHASKGISPELADTISEWRERVDIRIIVTHGNHDRNLSRLPDRWQIEWMPSLVEGPFRFVHDADRNERKDKLYTWAGHLHPTFLLRTPQDSLKLPCFYFDSEKAIIPAFNLFTRGLEMKRGPSTRIFVATENKVIEI